MDNLVIVQKNDLNNLLTQLENLVSGIEKMVDDSVGAEALQRLDEIKSGKTTAYTEDDYLKFMKKKGA